MPRCELCGTMYNGTLEGVYKQIANQFVWVEICPDCKEKHDREREMLRENFRRQFGDR